MNGQSLWFFITSYWFFYYFLIFLSPFFFYTDNIKKEILDSCDQNTTLGWSCYYRYKITAVWYLQIGAISGILFTFCMFFLITTSPYDGQLNILIALPIIGISYILQYLISRIILKVHDKYNKGERRLKKVFSDYFILYGRTSRKLILSYFFICTLMHAILFTKVCLSVL